ncbi:hypothetical protein SDC9_120090 [bioreactor metagenome]|uniref:Uncharacterized protein n=1 Tax=bioreactor metagenome TaxID=1076179 RepID=A0A645C9M5_9ZZZZ
MSSLSVDLAEPKRSLNAENDITSLGLLTSIFVRAAMRSVRLILSMNQPSLVVAIYHIIKDRILPYEI